MTQILRPCLLILTGALIPPGINSRAQDSIPASGAMTNRASATTSIVQTNHVAVSRSLRPAIHGRRQIIAGLNSTVLDQIVFDGLPLETVVAQLQAAFEKRHRNGRSLNFMYLDPVSAPVSVASPVAAQPGAPVLDPTGAPQNTPAVPAVSIPYDLRQATVRISSPLKNLTMAQALDVVIKNTEFPVMFSVNDYAIMVLPRPGNQFSNGFRTAPNTFQQGLQSVIGVAPTFVAP